MPHADSSFVPADITNKEEFYQHIHESLSSLLEGSRYWVSNLSQTASLLYHSYLSSSIYGQNELNHLPIVNWCGFYLHPPSPRTSTPPAPSNNSPLVLGPYCGRPACITISLANAKGVCANAFLGEKTLIVDDVEAYPGHIACDGTTQSEIVLPLIDSSNNVIGVLDLDSTSLSTFDEIDQQGLQRVIELLKESCDWI